MSDPGDFATRDIYNVTRLNREVRAVLEGSFPLLWVQGEISNLARPASGHIYFSLKDRHSQVRCAMFKNRLRSLRFSPENGMEVLARANVGLYEGRGEYQLIMEHLEPAGEGALQQAFERLKAALHQEGLFDAVHKRPLPAFPRSIGVITSASGAAIRDVLHVLQRRYPVASVIVYPVAVQGENSARQIVEALAKAERRDECDVLILTRGGGSLEDLWSFNEEVVARAIFQCKLPVVAGVGHEIDFTIADFVADQRAPTPSAAAELVSPNLPEIRTRLEKYEGHIRRLVRQLLGSRSEQLRHLQVRLPHPSRRLQEISQDLDELGLRMNRAIHSGIGKQKNLLLQSSGRLNRFHPGQLLQLHRERCRYLQEALHNQFNRRLENTTNRLKSLSHALHTVSPLATLERGYSISTTATGNVVTETTMVSPGDILRTRLATGELESRVEKVLEKDK